jgi:Tol biopolymer transport system component
VNRLLIAAVAIATAAAAAPADAHVSQAATTAPAGLIAYANEGDVWVVDADGRHRHQLTRDGSAYEPAWSPDGSRIAFASHTNGTDFEIYTMAADGTGVVEVTHDRGDDVEPSWSSDGSHILFSSNRSGSYDVWTAVAADGGDPVDLTPAPSDDFQASESPDGSTIAFVSDRDEKDGSVYLMAPDGTGTHRLVKTHFDRKPVWSPGSDRLAFVSCGVGTGSSCDDGTWVIGRDGVGLDKSVSGEAERPTWSPDDHWLAVGGTPNHPSTIYTVPFDADCVTALTAGGGASDPSWRPGAPPPTPPPGRPTVKVTLLTRTLGELRHGHVRVHISKGQPSTGIVLVSVDHKLVGTATAPYISATYPNPVWLSSSLSVSLPHALRARLAKAKSARIEVDAAVRSQVCRTAGARTSATVR